MPAGKMTHTHSYSATIHTPQRVSHMLAPESTVTRKVQVKDRSLALTDASRAWQRANRSGNSSKENFREGFILPRGIALRTFPPANSAPEISGKRYTGLVNQEAVEGKCASRQSRELPASLDANPCRERDTVHGAGNSDRLSSNGKAASSINSGKCSKPASSVEPHGTPIGVYTSQLGSVRNVAHRAACVG